MKSCYVLLLIALLCASVPAAAQEVVTARPVDPAVAQSLKRVFRQYALFQLSAADLARKVQGKASGEISLELQLPGMATLPMVLHQEDLLSPGYQLVVGSAAGREVSGRPELATLAGRLGDDYESSIRLTISPSLICGMVKGNGRQLFIEPLRYFSRGADPDVFVVYDAMDVVPHAGTSCILSEAQQLHPAVPDELPAYRGTGTATGTCRMVEVAIASDDSMLNKYGTAAAVQEHNIAIWNVVNGVYSNAQFGTQYLEFKIAGQYIATSVAANPLTPNYAGTDANTLLSNFQAWGQGGNFGFTYDIAQLMTTRNIASGGSSGVIGLAYVGATCTSFRYQLIEDFSGVIASLASCVAHETGHNLNASHDASGDPYIMAPSIANPPNTTFSPASISSITSYISGTGGNCFSACSAAAPIAQFNASQNYSCTGASITFTDYSVGQVTSRVWSFPGANITSATTASQAVTYATPGQKTVTLTVTNATGTASISKTIFVGDAPVTACRTTSAADTAKPVVLGFQLAGINRTDPFFYLSGNYTDASCSDQTELAAGVTYTAAIRVGINQAPYNYTGKPYLFIDYNNDGDFLDADESVLAAPACGQGTVSYSFTTPSSPAVTNTWLRMRLVVMSCYQAVVPTGCVNPSNAQVEDFSVYFRQVTAMPLVLLHFEGHGQNGGNVLEWQTASEHNHQLFEVQRSTDGVRFAAIGQVRSKGAAASIVAYEFTDDLQGATGATAYYYRLKMVATNGGYSYSPVIVVNGASAGEAAATVYPNPVAVGGTIQLHTSGAAMVSVFNSLGQLLYTQAIDGRTSVPLPAHWVPGLYHLRISNERGAVVRPLVIR